MRCSLNNVCTVDMRQMSSVEFMHATSKAPLHGPVPNDCAKQQSVEIESAPGRDIGMFDVFGVLPTLQALLNKLVGLVMGVAVGKPVDIFAPPDLNLNILPEPVPQAISPGPAPAGDIPGLSAKRNGAKPDDIWGGFRQGPDGNCVTVSAIKAAMHRFGQSPTDIYKEVTKIDGGYRVVMRDNFRLTLTDHELQQAVQGSSFVGLDREMLKDARFLYAASAKRAQMKNNDGTAGSSFYAAMQSLNDKEDEWGPGEGFERLGLRAHMRTVEARDLADGLVGMCNRRGHSVAVINGREELWGRQGGAPVYGDAIALV